MSEGQRTPAKVKRGHTFWQMKMKGTVKSFPSICTHCGLVALKNEATQKAIKAGCSGAQHEDQ